MKFYLGSPEVHWLRLAGVPLCVSRCRLARLKTWPEAAAEWLLDSGGFSELALRGGWGLSASAYVSEVRRYRDAVGRLEWAAPQDWMCEPGMIAKTGLSVREHQRRTVENFLDLKASAPDLPFFPVLQGWQLEDYLRHVEDYERVGVRLSREPLVGVGSVCRRQHTGQVEDILGVLAGAGARLHAFGAKVKGLEKTGDLLVSADSMAWSLAARKDGERLPECRHRARTCANCLRWALQWRSEVLRAVAPPCGRQLRLSLWGLD